MNFQTAYNQLLTAVSGKQAVVDGSMIVRAAEAMSKGASAATSPDLKAVYDIISQ